MNTLVGLTDSIKVGNRKQATELTQTAIDAKASPQEILEALLAGMSDVGERFKANEIFVPEVLIASRAMTESMALLEPLLVQAGITSIFTAVIGTVKGDLHDIGKNLVGMMLRGANVNVVDLGTDIGPEEFLEAAKEHNASIVGLSALLTTTMEQMKEVIKAFKSEGIESTKIIIGGAPITQEFADEIGADGFAEDAASAVEIAKTLDQRLQTA